MAEYVDRYGSTSTELLGGLELGVKIQIMAPQNILDSASLAIIIRDKGEAIMKALQAEKYRVQPGRAEEAASERENLLKCFTAPIFVETIPNGYCREACCEHRPWFIVTTAKGRITIGWRKRVISIDWSDSIINALAEEMFPEESTTKFNQTIHAWSYDKATEYIRRIVTHEEVIRQ